MTDTMTVEKLDEKTKARIPEMFKKGYRYICQVSLTDLQAGTTKDFGEPLFFKSAYHVGPFLRTLSTGYGSAKVVWTVNLDNFPGCRHNSMTLNDNPKNTWKCADCGYVYGSEK